MNEIMRNYNNGLNGSLNHRAKSKMVNKDKKGTSKKS